MLTLKVNRIRSLFQFDARLPKKTLVALMSDKFDR